MDGKGEGEGRRGIIGRSRSIAKEGYLPAYLKRVEDEVDEPETTIEELEEVSLEENDLDKEMLVGTLLTREGKEKLMLFLRRNKDIFT